MGIESGTTIATLDSSWPLSGDYISEGDNHVRLLKAVLKAQFPGVGGLGFAVPITATEVEINYLSGTTSGIQAQLDTLATNNQDWIPAGTIMLFYQPAAPVGWTQIADDDNSMIRMVSGAGDVGGAFGGTDSPINYAHVHTTAAHALTIAEMPAHTHDIRFNLGAHYDSSSTNFGSGAGGAVVTQPTLDLRASETAGSGDAHTHGDTESTTFTPRYVNVIQASKD